MASNWARLLRYALAVAIFGIVLILRLLIAPAESGLPFLTFYPPPVISIYLFGKPLPIDQFEMLLKRD